MVVPSIRCLFGWKCNPNWCLCEHYCCWTGFQRRKRIFLYGVSENRCPSYLSLINTGTYLSIFPILHLFVNEKTMDLYSYINDALIMNDQGIHCKIILFFRR